MHECVRVFVRLSACLRECVFYLRDAGAAGNHRQCAVPSGNRAGVFVRQNKYSLFIGVISSSINYIRCRADTIRGVCADNFSLRPFFSHIRTADTRNCCNLLADKNNYYSALLQQGKYYF